jgi:hypothetical protein
MAQPQNNSNRQKDIARLLREQGIKKFGPPVKGKGSMSNAAKYSVPRRSA